VRTGKRANRRRLGGARARRRGAAPATRLAPSATWDHAVGGAGVARGVDGGALQERVRAVRGGATPPRRAVAACGSWCAAMRGPRRGGVGCWPWVGGLQAQSGWGAAHCQAICAPGARPGTRFRGAPGAGRAPGGARLRGEGRGAHGSCQGPRPRRGVVAGAQGHDGAPRMGRRPAPRRPRAGIRLGRGGARQQPPAARRRARLLPGRAPRRGGSRGCERGAARGTPRRTGPPLGGARQAQAVWGRVAWQGGAGVGGGEQPSGGSRGACDLAGRRARATPGPERPGAAAAGAAPRPRWAITRWAGPGWRRADAQGPPGRAPAWRRAAGRCRRGSPARRGRALGRRRRQVPPARVPAPCRPGTGPWERRGGWPRRETGAGTPARRPRRAGGRRRCA